MPTKEKVTRKLRAILSADVKGYSLLMSDDEAYTVRKLEEYRTRMSNLIKANSGRVVDAVGDNLLAEFSSAVDAIQCAVEIQKALKAKNSELTKEKQLKFRIGVNIGDVIQDTVNIASRNQGLNKQFGTEILISITTKNNLSNDADYEKLPATTIKGKKELVEVFKVS